MRQGKTKILYTMPGKVAGGGHLGTLQIMDRLRSYGFEPIAVVNHMESHVVDLMREYGISSIFVPGYPGLLMRNTPQFVNQVFIFWRTIKREKISLLHLSDLITGHYGILAARLARIPSVLHMKSLYWTKEYGWPNRLILSRASMILAISDAVHRACLEARLPEDRIVTIHDGIDLKPLYVKENMGLKVRSDMGIPEDRFVIGFVGRLGVKWKNEPLVYRLVGELSQQIENLSLLVVGGPYDGKNETFENSKRLARELGGKAEIRFLGSRKDVSAILPAMDVYLVPSKEEPFGRVVIEGMAAGLAVVGSNNGGIPEIITDGHDGFLKAPDDLNGWVSVVRTLSKNPDLRKHMGNNARKTVEDFFTLEKMIEKVAKIYFNLLKTLEDRQPDNFCSRDLADSE